MARPLHSPLITLGARLFFVTLLAACLLAGLAGGLVRAGVPLPAGLAGAWLGPAVQAHAFLMICVFLGTVIGIERAVAARVRWAFAAPLAAALAGLATLAGRPPLAAQLGVLAALAFVAVNVLLVRRQSAPHTRLLLLGALAWLVGNLGYAASGSPHATVPWWFAFLVLTIAAERLEMTRLMRRRPGAASALGVALAALLAGCALFAVSPVWGGTLYGAALVALALWLIAFDIARRTLAAAGLSRYMAVCLLLGYFWLALAGVAWCATAWGLPLMDAAIHALALGFVFSMLLAHAPVILPALTRIKVAFGWPWYGPLALLHGSLALRLLLRHTDLDFALAAGAAGNALAILLFAATLAGSALVWRRTHPPRTTPS